MSVRLAYRLRYGDREVSVYDDDAIYYKAHCTAENEVHINRDLPVLIWHETLLHELIHVAEQTALAEGAITSCAPETYVEEIGKRLFALLAGNGFYCPRPPAWVQPAMDLDATR